MNAFDDMTHPQEMYQVFVYGTLKPGEANYHYCEGQVIQQQAAIAYGTLFDLPMGYPVMTEGSDRVYGYLLSFADPAVLAALDELEDYHPDRPIEENDYLRQEIDVFGCDRQPLGRAWTYVMPLERAKRLGGFYLPNGKWAAAQ